MPTVLDQELYDKAKKQADAIYTKPSAYKSGFIQRKYKELGGRFREDNKPKALANWFQEKWKNVAEKGQYPVLRPTVRVSKATALTVKEIDPKQLKKQVALKQVIKGKKNLPPFKPK